MSYKPLQVANYFLKEHGPNGKLTHLKLQKLVYFANGWRLGLNGGALVNERPQVWRYGPVFASLYRALARFGQREIEAPVEAMAASSTIALVDDLDVQKFLEKIWGEYGDYSGPELSDLTHARGTPWRKVAEEYRFRVPYETIIPEADDKAYFSKLAGN